MVGLAVFVAALGATAGPLAGSVAIAPPRVPSALAELAQGAEAWLELQLGAADVTVVDANGAELALESEWIRSGPSLEVRLRLRDQATGALRLGVRQRGAASDPGQVVQQATGVLLDSMGRSGDATRAAPAPTPERLARASRALAAIERGELALAQRSVASRASALAEAIRSRIADATPDAPVSERARVLVADDQVDAAARLLRPLLDEAGDARLLLAAAEVALAQNDPRRARRHLERAIALDPGLADAHLALGRLLSRISERERARRALARAAELRRSDPEPVEALAQIDREGRRADHLLEAARRAERRFEFSRAQRHYERIEALAPSRRAEIQGLRGSAYERAGEVERARLAYEQAVELGSTEPATWRGAARARLAAGDPAGAERAWREALDRGPNDPETLRELGSFYLEQAQPDAARPILERAVALEPAHGGTRRDLARALHEAGESERAVALLEETPSPAAPELREAARIRLAGGDREGARRDLERAVALDPDDPELQRELADAAEAVGDGRAASRARELAVRLDGGASLEALRPRESGGDEAIVFDGAAWLAVLVDSFPRVNPESRMPVERVALVGMAPPADWQARAVAWLAPRRLDESRILSDMEKVLSGAFQLVPVDTAVAPAAVRGLWTFDPTREDIAEANRAFGTQAVFVLRAGRGGSLEARMMLGAASQEVALLANAIELPAEARVWWTANPIALSGYAAALLALLWPLLRGWGSVVVKLEYLKLGRTLFTVRLSRKPGQAKMGKGREKAIKRFRRRAREWSRFSRTIEGRALTLRWIPARTWYVTVHGVLEDRTTGEVTGNYFEEQTVTVRRGKPAELLFDFRPTHCSVEVCVTRGEELIDRALVAVEGKPDSMRVTRGGVTHLAVDQGRYTILVGHHDRVLTRRIQVDSLEPTSTTIDLGDSAATLFEGCPDAVEPFVSGAREEAAAHLERIGNVQLARRLHAERARQRGDGSTAAELFEESERWAEAGAAWLEQGQPERAARCFEQAGDPAAAAGAWLKAGDPVAAGRCHEEAYDHEAAAECYRRAGERERLTALLEKTGDYFAAAECAVADANADRAIENLQRIDPAHGHYREAARMLGDLFASKGEVALAIEKLEEAIAGSRSDSVPIAVRMKLATLLEEAGLFERAVAAYEEVQRHDFHHPEVAERLEAVRARVAAAQATTRIAKGTGAPSAEPSEERYEIRGELGRGGMGIVLEAWDKRLERTVALKRLPDNLSEHPKAVELFLREARAAAKLNHANIVTVHDVDQRDGAYFITMERLEGAPLNHLLRKRGRFSANAVARIGVQVCAGLHFAHQQKIVHRDIKTSNLFVTRDQIVKIMDFGLAKSLAEVRRAGTVIGGTPYYMAPEQAVGDRVDHRADLYALGATLFELATGGVPFSEGDLAYHHRHTPPPDPRERVPDLPEGLARLILQLLAKARDARPESAAEVAARLKSLLRAA